MTFVRYLVARLNRIGHVSMFTQVLLPDWPQQRNQVGIPKQVYLF